MNPEPLPPLSYTSFFAFDVDSTITESKQPLDDEMAEILTRLLARTNVAIISGGKFDQLRRQVADRLAGAALDHFFILPTSGASLYVHKGEWKNIYEESIPLDEAERVEAAIEEAVEESGMVPAGTPSYGERIEYRGAQISFSALGQDAPVTEKKSWDPDMAKRKVIQALLEKSLPGYDIKLGGMTTIDITKHGVNKAFGMRKLSEYTEISISDMLYIGDQLGPGGNDEVVKETGIATHAVTGVPDTKEFLNRILT